MSLSAVALLEELRSHLAGDATLEGYIRASLFHGRADLDAACPFAVYRVTRLEHETGYGPQEATGQTTEAVILLTAVDEGDGIDTTTLSSIADALDDLMRSWDPNGWHVRTVILASERLDSFDREGRTYQTATMSYSLAMERA